MQIRPGSKQGNDPEGWYGAGHHCSRAKHFSAPFVRVVTLQKMRSHKENYLLRLNYCTLCTILGSVEKRHSWSFHYDHWIVFNCSCKYTGRKL